MVAEGIGGQVIWFCVEEKLAEGGLLCQYTKT